jgi:hypothetical protein
MHAHVVLDELPGGVGLGDVAVAPGVAVLPEEGSLQGRVVAPDGLVHQVVDQPFFEL